MANKEEDEKAALWIECLQMRIGIEGMMTPKEKKFAEGLIGFYRDHGYLSLKQGDSARRLAVRLIVDRDKDFF